MRGEYQVTCPVSSCVRERERDWENIYFLDKEDLLPGASGILKQSEKVTLILFSLLEHIFWSLAGSEFSCMSHFSVELSLSHMSWNVDTSLIESDSERHLFCILFTQLQTRK